MDNQILQTIIDEISKTIAEKVSEKISEQRNDPPSLMTIDELATHLNIPKSWIYDRTRDNTIPHVKIGKYVRFSLPDVLNWLKTIHD